MSKTILYENINERSSTFSASSVDKDLPFVEFFRLNDRVYESFKIKKK